MDKNAAKTIAAVAPAAPVAVAASPNAADAWVPEKDEYSDAELRASPPYTAIMSGPTASFFSDNEGTLLSFLRRKIAEKRKNVSSLRLKPMILALFESLTKEGVAFSDAKGVRIFPDGHFKAPSGMPRQPSVDFSKLIGKTLITKVGEKADESKRGTYKAHIRPPLASRSDVAFSIVLEQPHNAPNITYPAADPKNVGANEADSLTGICAASLLKQNYAPAQVFRKDLKKLLKSDEDEPETETPKKGAKPSKSATPEASDEDEEDSEEPDLEELLDGDDD